MSKMFTEFRQNFIGILFRPKILQNSTELFDGINSAIKNSAGFFDGLMDTLIRLCFSLYKFVDPDPY